MGNNNLHDGHRDRMRQRFINEGLDTFEYHEIMELLLYHSIPRKNTNEIAHKLCNHFDKSLSAILDASFDELMRVEGINANSATLIKFIAAINRKYSLDKLNTEGNINTREKYCEYLISWYTGVMVETVIILCLDNKHDIISTNVIHEGSINSAMVSMRKIVEIAVQKQASSIIIAHNHPNGLAIPSADDLRTTKRIYSVLSAIDINMVDHYLIAGSRAVGLLSNLDI